MKLGRFFLFILIITIPCPLFGFKFVGLVPVRNEQNIIAQCLKALSKYTDAIVVLDDFSSDKTVAIIESLAEECHIERIIKKNAWHRNEPGDKNKLLQAGREIGGTHFIVIDADEMLTSNFLKNNMLRTIVSQLQPGDTLALCWIQLWRSINYYRFDNSVWTWNYKTIVFADMPGALYYSGFIHTAPIPHGLRGKKIQLKGYKYGLLHFQFVNWRNLLIKQAWYRCLERIRYMYKSSQEINAVYASSKDEQNIHRETSNSDWFSGYDFFDSSVFDRPELWRELQIIEWFEKYGKNHFRDLDIWDLDWKI